MPVSIVLTLLFHTWPGEVESVLFGPFVDDVGELAGVVVGFVCGDLVQGGDGLGETVLCDRFAGGPVVPRVESVDAGLGGREVFGEVLPLGEDVVGP